MDAGGVWVFGLSRFCEGVKCCVWEFACSLGCSMVANGYGMGGEDSALWLTLLTFSPLTDLGPIMGEMGLRWT